MASRMAASASRCGFSTNLLRAVLCQNVGHRPSILSPYQRLITLIPLGTERRRGADTFNLSHAKQCACCTGIFRLVDEGVWELFHEG